MGRESTDVYSGGFSLLRITHRLIMYVHKSANPPKREIQIRRILNFSLILSAVNDGSASQLFGCFFSVGSELYLSTRTNNLYIKGN